MEAIWKRLRQKRVDVAFLTSDADTERFAGYGMRCARLRQTGVLAEQIGLPLMPLRRERIMQRILWREDACGGIAGELVGSVVARSRCSACLPKMQNVGKVLTHTFITQKIWGSSWDNDIASLRVFMATLRKKLESGPDSPQYIQTHIGVGYRMMKVE